MSKDNYSWLDDGFGELFHPSPWANKAGKGIKYSDDEGFDITEEVDQLKQTIISQIEKIEKAYGGCNKCYGKGYATEHNVTSSRLGSSTKLLMNYCTCDRGKQLANQIEIEKLRAVEDYQLKEHLFRHIPGGTSIECSCGETFGATDMAQQHRQWHLDILIRLTEKLKELEIKFYEGR